MSTGRIRVVVVDDSAFARKVMREVLSADPRIDVVATARDGLDALEKIAETNPDVVTLDLVMPELDGVGVLEALRKMSAPPRVVVVTMSDADSALGVAALQSGAFDVVHKPTALATDRLYELGEELVSKVVLASESPFGAHAIPNDAIPPFAQPGAAATPLRAKHASFLAIGASTGGPRAVTQLLRALPGDFPVPVAVVVHMPPGYTEAFAHRLDRECALHVVEATEGLELVPGLAVVARAGIHLEVHRKGASYTAHLNVQPMEALHRPSVDALFETVARAAGNGALGVVLTGMGADGLIGARRIHAAGGRLVVEAASTCVVYGMPRVVFEAGLADAALPLQDVARAIIARL